MDYRKILDAFNQRYGYVTIDLDIVEKFVNEFHSDNIDLLYDYCLSRDENYGVQE